MCISMALPSVNLQWFTPCAGHVVYVLQSTPLCVFTGDHLFIGGTGMYICMCWCGTACEPSV